MNPLLLHLLLFALLNLLLVIAGYLIQRKRWVMSGWLLTVASIAAAHFIFLNDTPLIRMGGILYITFTAAKALVTATSYQGKQNQLSFIQWSAFAIGWVGMRAEPFETLGSQPLPGARGMIGNGLIRVALGLILILLVHIIAPVNMYGTLKIIILSALSLISLSLILHFGLLSISAGAWRLMGVNTYYLFRHPARSTSLTEFWGKRWNIAFIEMNAIVLFRPLQNQIGVGPALILSFLFSGLLHEVAISLPVYAGFGLPTLYFLIQGLAVFVEKKIAQHEDSFMLSKTLARVWTYFWVIAPTPLLFHQAFIRHVVFPLIGLKL